ncbi:contractile injection system protein, VgrG/Pvc8 family [Nannocystis sp.]|uniref:phage late control D family protein n=1 Tax=Nannocystis sp. TaxID=1962667 RepID=UPI002426B4F4|nr:contractile injection system protein, VgrG/Pvc8 family [Nannocystis sp.]MBK7823661.1 phage late control D family protein [Nannocystis sp.]MBK9755827.1 phage late control D family protein [Nannocystis sp.]
MTDGLFHAVRPVLRTRGIVREELGRDLIRLEIEEATDGLKTLCARFIAVGPNDEPAYLDGTLLDFGLDIIVSVGPTSSARTVFRGTISALEATFDEAEAPEVAVYAEDRLMDLRMTRRTRSYDAMTDADIVREVASAHQLAVEVDIEDTTHEVVQQWNQSDLAFLRERARLVRAELWLDDAGTLQFKARDRRSATELTLVRGGALLDLHARADLAHQRTAVRVSGFDSDARVAIDEEADDAVIRGEVSHGRTGPAILRQAFGERVSQRAREVPLTTTEAAAVARAEMQRRARRFVQVHGLTTGTPDMIVGTRLTLERVGRPFSGGGYHVTRVRHTHDLARGFRTEFSAERPTLEEGA